MKKFKSYNIDVETSKYFETNKAFFAFNKRQLEEKLEKFKLSKNGIKQIDFGIIIPKEIDTKKFLDGYSKIIDNKIEWEKKNNSVKAIVFKCYADYETQITGDKSRALDDIRKYGISEEIGLSLYKEYFEMCVKNDWF